MMDMASILFQRYITYDLQLNQQFSVGSSS
jgi:hypothetical protein